MRGLLHTYEALIAVGVLGVIILVFYRSLPTPELSELNYKLSGFEGIEILEKSNLREYVLNNDATSIKNSLAQYFPTLSYDVVIYNRTSNLTTIPAIEAEKIITVSYFLAGDVGNYSAREVRIYIWGFE
ncbi:MAG: hypothetical protein QXO27_04010 [Candidatus Aenigmatarchaeota archaeon]